MSVTATVGENATVGVGTSFALSLDDELIAMAEVPDHLPKASKGRPMSRVTPWRWANAGIKARNGETVKLPTIQLGGSTFTSAAALRWFSGRLSAARQG